MHLPPPGLDEPGETLRRILFPESQATQAAAAPPYQPKPPLWRSLPEKTGSPGWSVGTLANIAALTGEAGIKPPAITVIGAVAGFTPA